LVSFETHPGQTGEGVRDEFDNKLKKYQGGFSVRFGWRTIMDTTNRRRFLELAGLVAVTSVAGCAEIDGSETSSNDQTTTENEMMADEMTTEDEMMDEETTTEDEMMDEETTTEDEMMDEETTTEDEMMDEEMTELELTTKGLPELDMGTYEGWAIFPDEKVSTGTFTPGDSVSLSVDRNLRGAQKFVVTIEPSDDSDPSPSGVVALEGAFEGSEASLSFPISLADTGGSYILATPTNGADSHETAGVWFLDPSGPAASLSLPELPSGWVYEGWVATQGHPISTGRFDEPMGADGHSDYSGSNDGPPFPGEDLLRNAPMGVDFPADLADGNTTIVVSVEPDLGGMDPTGPKPFAIKPLVGDVPNDAADHTSYALKTNAETTPTGSVTRQ
jgi:hypothetical protein